VLLAGWVGERTNDKPKGGEIQRQSAMHTGGAASVSTDGERSGRTRQHRT
jgi:hypothetical protein